QLNAEVHVELDHSIEWGMTGEGKRVLRTREFSGRQRTFEYDNDTGKLQRIVTNDGIEIVRTGDQEWKVSDGKTPVQTFAGDYGVDPETGAMWTQVKETGRRTDYLLDGGRRVTEKNGGSFLIDRRGNLRELTDANGRTLAASYDPTGRLSEISTPGTNVLPGD